MEQIDLLNQINLLNQNVFLYQLTFEPNGSKLFCSPCSSSKEMYSIFYVSWRWTLRGLFTNCNYFWRVGPQMDNLSKLRTWNAISDLVNEKCCIKTSKKKCHKKCIISTLVGYGSRTFDCKKELGANFLKTINRLHSVWKSQKKSLLTLRSKLHLHFEWTKVQ